MAVNRYADNYYDPMPTVDIACVPFHRHVKFTQPGTAFVIEDVVFLINVNADIPLVLENYFIDVPDLDTGGTPAITLDLGYNGTNNEDNLIDGSTVGQAAGFLTPEDGLAGAMPDLISADCQIQLHVDAAPQTGTTDAVIKGWFEFIKTGVAITL